MRFLTPNPSIGKPIHFPLQRLPDVVSYEFNKLTSIFLCICPVMDHEFRHNIVKLAIAVDPGGDSRVDPKTTLRVVRRIHNKTNKTDA